MSSTAISTCSPAGLRDRDGRIGPLLPVVGAGLAAPVVDGRTLPYANLDNAASAPALRSVADRVSDVLPFYSSVHRGAGYASQVSTALYEGARRTVAAFLGARDDDVVVVVRNTTDALNLLASAVPRADRADRAGGQSRDVLVLDVEHHANLLPWQGGPHRVLPAEATIERTLAAVAAALAARPTALLAVTGCSNVTGELLPLAHLVALAHAAGARIAVDAAQLAPHRRIDLRSSGIDYVALSGHKLYAPFGAGVLVGRRDWLDEAAPYLAGGGAVHEVAIESTSWAPAPQRHEAGTPNVIGAVALAAACEAVAALPAGALEEHEAALTQRLLEGLATLDGVEVLRLWPDSHDRAGVVSFAVRDHDPGLVAAYLSAEHAVGVRDGRFCAHPLLTRLGLPQGAVRASLGVGSSSDDVDRLVGALEHLLLRGRRWQYEIVEGRWAPTPDPRPTAPVLTDLFSPGASLTASLGSAPASPCGAPVRAGGDGPASRRAGRPPATR